MDIKLQRELERLMGNCKDWRNIQVNMTFRATMGTVKVIQELKEYGRVVVDFIDSDGPHKGTPVVVELITLEDLFESSHLQESLLDYASYFTYLSGLDVC